jgi:hypothetical protein
MSPRTTFLCKLIGYCILMSLSMVAHRQATVEAMTALIHNPPPLVFVVGGMAVAAGLAMVLGHNIWSGSALPVTVTLIGWPSRL